MAWLRHGCGVGEGGGLGVLTGVHMCTFGQSNSMYLCVDTCMCVCVVGHPPPLHTHTRARAHTQTHTHARTQTNTRQRQTQRGYERGEERTKHAHADTRARALTRPHPQQAVLNLRGQGRHARALVGASGARLVLRGLRPGAQMERGEARVLLWGELLTRWRFGEACWSRACEIEGTRPKVRTRVPRWRPGRRPHRVALRTGWLAALAGAATPARKAARAGVAAAASPRACKGAPAAHLGDVHARARAVKLPAVVGALHAARQRRGSGVSGELGSEQRGWVESAPFSWSGSPHLPVHRFSQARQAPGRAAPRRASGP